MNISFKYEIFRGNYIIFKNIEVIKIWDEIKKILNTWIDEMNLILGKNKVERGRFILLFDNSNLTEIYKKKINGIVHYKVFIDKDDYSNYPDYFLEYINKIKKEKFSFFIWIAGRTYNRDEKVVVDNIIHVIWTLVHELEHIKQYLSSGSKILKIDRFLNIYKESGDYLGFKGKDIKFKFELPLEFYAQKRGSEIVENRFGKSQVIDFIKNRVRSGDKYFKNYIEYFDPKINYDIIKWYCDILSENKERLKEFQRFYIKDFFEDSEFDKICENCETWFMSKNNL